MAEKRKHPAWENAAYSNIVAQLLPVLDVEKDAVEIHNIAMAMLQNFEIRQESILEIEAVSSGYSLSARNFLVELDDEKYILRSTSLETRFEARENEVKANMLLGKSALSPAVHYANANDGIIITRFIEEALPKWNGRFSKEMAFRLVEKLKALHQTPDHEKIFNLEISASGLPNDSRLRITRVLQKGTGFFLQKFLHHICTQLESLLDKETLVHHDLHSGNILYDGDAFWFIDLEHVGIGDRYVDLAVICLIIRPDLELENAFLEAYFGRKLTTAEQHKVYFSKIVSCLRYALSSFSNCVDYESLHATNLFPVCRFADYTPEIDGIWNLGKDEGMYLQCIALAKQAINELAGPQFSLAMSVLTKNETGFWGTENEVHALMAGIANQFRQKDPVHRAVPQEAGADRPDWTNQISAYTLLGLARLLRNIAVIDTTSGLIPPDNEAAAFKQCRENVSGLIQESGAFPFLNELLAAYDHLESLLAPYYGQVYCCYDLQASNLVREKMEVHEKFRITNWAVAGLGYPLLDLATVVNELDLSKEQETFLLICFGGSRQNAQYIAYYDCMRRFAALRSAICFFGANRIEKNEPPDTSRFQNMEKRVKQALDNWNQLILDEYIKF